MQVDDNKQEQFGDAKGDLHAVFDPENENQLAQSKDPQQFEQLHDSKVAEVRHDQVDGDGGSCVQEESPTQCVIFGDLPGIIDDSACREVEMACAQVDEDVSHEYEVDNCVQNIELGNLVERYLVGDYETVV